MIDAVSATSIVFSGADVSGRRAARGQAAPALLEAGIRIFLRRGKVVEAGAKLRHTRMGAATAADTTLSDRQPMVRILDKARIGCPAGTV
jgi:hypothetical protein